MINLRDLAEEKIGQIRTYKMPDGSVTYDCMDTVFTVLDIIEMYEEELSITQFESRVNLDELEFIKRIVYEMLD